MIQRIQTLYLSITVILTLLLLKAGLISLTDHSGAVFKLSSSGTLLGSGGHVFAQVGYRWPLITLAILLIVLSLATIFMFRKRRVQILLSISVIAISSGLVAAYSWYIIMAARNNDLTMHPGIRMALPVLILIFSILAYRGISKDDRLVRSYDRLR